jgi:hypothetical protein
MFIFFFFFSNDTIYDLHEITREFLLGLLREKVYFLISLFSSSSRNYYYYNYYIFNNYIDGKWCSIKCKILHNKRSEIAYNIKYLIVWQFLRLSFGKKKTFANFTGKMCIILVRFFDYNVIYAIYYIVFAIRTRINVQVYTTRLSKFSYYNAGSNFSSNFYVEISTNTHNPVHVIPFWHMIYNTCFNETSSTVSGVGNIRAVFIYFGFYYFFFFNGK